MKRFLYAAVLVLILSVSIQVQAKEVDMQEGQWQITSKVEMEGMSMEMPATTVTQCITRKDIVPQKTEPGQDCSVKNMTTNGNTVSWNIVCSSKEGTMETNGTVTYRGTSFDGAADVTMKTDGGPMKMKTTMSGRRIGDCR